MCNIENPITIGVGDYVRKIRLSIGYTQYDMADALAISQNAYCLLENGQTKFSFERLVQVAIIMGLNPLEFIKGYFNELEK